MVLRRFYKPISMLFVTQLRCQSTWTWIHRLVRLWLSWPERRPLSNNSGKRRRTSLVWCVDYDRTSTTTNELSLQISWEPTSSLLCIKEEFHQEWCLNLRCCWHTLQSRLLISWRPGMVTASSSISCVRLSRRSINSVRWSCPASCTPSLLSLLSHWHVQPLMSMWEPMNSTWNSCVSPLHRTEVRQ